VHGDGLLASWRDLGYWHGKNSRIHQTALNSLRLVVIGGISTGRRRKLVRDSERFLVYKQEISVLFVEEEYVKANGWNKLFYEG
jgi:hypothetical protein